MNMTLASNRTLDNLKRHVVFRGILTTMVLRRAHFRAAARTTHAARDLLASLKA